MMRFILLLALAFATEAANARDLISFFGRAERQDYLSKVKLDCPTAGLCMDVVYAWTIRVKHVNSGNIAERTVKAAMVQHTEYIYAGKQDALYVISKIEDPEKRKLLGVDYWLVAYAPPQKVTLYCLQAPDVVLQPSEQLERLDESSCYQHIGPAK